jgi:hypothetical protein
MRWSVWIALREWATSVRTLKEATIFGGMLGFGPTLQLRVCGFLFFPWGVPVCVRQWSEQMVIVWEWLLLLDALFVE